MASLRGLLCPFLLVSSVLSIGTAARADDGLTVLGDGSDMLTLGAGAFNMQNHQGHDQGQVGPAAEGLVEWHGGQKWMSIGPAVGVIGNSGGGAMGYVAGYAEIAYDRFVLTPQAGVGAYYHGGELDTGSMPAPVWASSSRTSPMPISTATTRARTTCC